MIAKSVVSISFFTIAFLPGIGFADAPQPKPATSQPTDGMTMIQAMIVQFSSTSQTMTPKEIRKQLAGKDADADGLKALLSTGKLTVLSRPAIVVKWPQSAEITVGDRVPVATEDSNDNAVKHENVGVHLAVEGQWLDQVDAARAYLRFNLRYTYLNNRSENASHQPALLGRDDIQKECIVADGKTTWMVSPQKDSKSFIVIGLTIHRIKSASPEK